jgi:3-hydroxyacyl-CoA dehydrogenase
MLSVTELAGAVTRALVVAHVSHEKRAAGLHWNGPVPTAWSVALSPAHAYTLSLTTLTVHWARATKDAIRRAALKIQRTPKVPIYFVNFNTNRVLTSCSKLLISISRKTKYLTQCMQQVYIQRLALLKPKKPGNEQHRKP